MKNENSTWVFLYIKYSKFWSLSLEHFVERKPLISEEWYIFIHFFCIFLAPEILDEAQAFPQSDIWSLGVLLYVLLSGQLPFKGESADETKTNILDVKFKFEWLYNEVTMEATRLLMWIFKRAPW